MRACEFDPAQVIHEEYLIVLANVGRIQLAMHFQL
jgi:hypothetical protein